MRPLFCTLAAGAIVGCNLMLGDYSVGAADDDEAPGDSDAAVVEAVPDSAMAAPVFQSTACADCMAEHCGPAMELCGADALCSSWQDEWAKCAPTDGQCRLEAYPDRTNELMGDVFVCSFEHCAASDQCSVGMYGWRTAECEACTIAVDKGEHAACRADQDCLDRIRCDFRLDNVVTPDPDETMACHAHGDVYAKVELEGDQLDNKPWMQAAVKWAQFCKDDCAFGERVDCAQNELPVDPVTQVSARLFRSFAEEVAGVPERGETVYLCQDAACESPFDFDTTDAYGHVVFDFPPGGNANVHFRATVTTDDDERVPMIFYPMGPVVPGVEVPLRIPSDSRKDKFPWTRQGGLIVAAARECVGTFAGHEVTLELDPPGAQREVYFAEIPLELDPSATSGPVRAFVDVEPNTYTIRVLDADGHLIASKANVRVERGTRTNVPWVWP